MMMGFLPSRNLTKMMILQQCWWGFRMIWFFEFTCVSHGLIVRRMTLFQCQSCHQTFCFCIMVNAKHNGNKKRHLLTDLGFSLLRRPGIAGESKKIINTKRIAPWFQLLPASNVKILPDMRMFLNVSKRERGTSTIYQANHPREQL